MIKEKFLTINLAIESEKNDFYPYSNNNHSYETQEISH